MRDLLAKPLLVVTGKGGVGKSTVAAALGMAAAARGLRTIVAEVAARDDVSRTLAPRGADGPGRSFVERDLGDGLHHISIDPESALEEYLKDQLPRGVADLLAASRMFSYLTAATPGLRELLTVGKVWELAQPDRRTPGAHPYDLVILDAPATGHGVAVLTAPGTFADAARLGPVARQGGIIHGMLADPQQTGIVAVAAPEEMPVNETLALQRTLRDGLGQPLAAVVANGVLPARFTKAEGEALAAAPPSGPIRAARAEAARSRGHRAQLARLRRGVGSDVEVRSLPFLFATTLETPELQRLGEELVR
ncbi:MAG TPA: ArsA-related P-loop ATPase [Baekduia sp.]|uniref:ArsA family ATPase n=1 Tax=Baekduia sp. TaxID=2600305 RepID=UPI002C535BC1|nr:ArsA-related P-loop ATPase [Baekduia sp.]HMJ36828.1 ArsA-related P-loop ATPase [Baekduia sp.]